MKAVTEAELKAKAIAPRVTLEDVQAFVKSVDFCIFPGTMLTVCCITGQNGFSFSGESACADPANFDEEIGQRLAKGQAMNKIWAFLGFELKTKLSLVQNARGPSKDGMTTHVGTKVIHAKPMTRQEWCAFRGWVLPQDEDGSDEGYLVEYADGGKPNIEGFQGYVSWSPKDVFDRSYGPSLGSREAESWVDRLKREAQDLQDKLDKLFPFLESQETCDLDARLPKETLRLLHHQFELMSEYRDVLIERMPVTS